MRPISLVTTVRNEAGSARDLIEAVRRQSRPPDEWVVVDGGSTDGTAELFAAEPTCRLLRAPGNIAHGRNVAISYAAGDLIAVTDGGCRPAPDWLALLIEPLAADRADIAAGDTIPYLRRPFHVAQWALLDRLVMPSMPFRKPALSSRSLAFRREVWEHTAYPEWLDHGEDTWVIRSWIAAGRRLERVPGATVEWRLRDSVPAFLAQHFRYMRGDGRARLHGWRHLARFAFYLGLAGLLVWSVASRPWAAVAAAGLWLTYLAATTARLAPLLPGRGLGDAIRSLAWVAPLLLGMDAAKAVGYLRGQRPGPGSPLTMTELAIVIVHYRAEELLAECVRRLRASSHADFRAVIVDNGSTRPLEGFAGDPRFELLRAPENLGYAAATNLALDRLPHDIPFVLLLNPDVQVERETLAAVLGALATDSAAGAATPRLILPSGELDPACRRSEPTPLTALAKQLGLQRLFPRSRFIGRYNLTYLDPDVAYTVDSASGAFLLLRREALERAGGRLDESFFLYGEDLDLCRRLREVGYRILYHPEARAVHVKGSGRIRPARTTFHFYRSMWTYYRKWGRGRNNPLLLAPLALTLTVLMQLEICRNGVRRLGRQSAD